METVNSRELLNNNRKDRTEGVGRLTQAQRAVLNLYRRESKGTYTLEARAKIRT